MAQRRVPARDGRVDDSAGGRPEPSAGVEEVCCSLWCGRGAVAGPSAMQGGSRREAEELQVANTKKLRFEDFMETFLETATRIADGIDLDTFVEPASPGASPGDA